MRTRLLLEEFTDDAHLYVPQVAPGGHRHKVLLASTPTHLPRYTSPLTQPRLLRSCTLLCILEFLLLGVWVLRAAACCRCYRPGRPSDAPSVPWLLQAPVPQQCGCRRRHRGASTSPRSVPTAAEPSAATTRSSGIFKISTSSPTRCTCASFVTVATARRTRSPRTRVCSIAAQAGCWSVCWRRRPSRVCWGRIRPCSRHPDYSESGRRRRQRPRRRRRKITRRRDLLTKSLEISPFTLMITCFPILLCRRTANDYSNHKYKIRYF